MPSDAMTDDLQRLVERIEAASGHAPICSTTSLASSAVRTGRANARCLHRQSSPPETRLTAPLGWATCCDEMLPPSAPASPRSKAMDSTMVAVTPSGFQSEVADWMLACFGPEIAADRLERADRFTEEALELAQTMPGFNAERAHALVDYVFGRDIGERGQEVGGVMVTLAALCNTFDISISAEAERELARVWTKVEAIRAKQASKPVGSALPIARHRIQSEGRTGAGEALRKPLENVTEWLTAALECKTWAWDGDQREAATMDRDAAIAALSQSTTGEDEVDRIAQRICDAGKEPSSPSAWANTDEFSKAVWRKYARAALGARP